MRRGCDNYDEYGNQTGTTPNTGPSSYGWVGTNQRATDNSGLILMGARLYNPVAGLFTSIDPVAGGNTTDYTYPQDPINKYDLDGNAWSWRTFWTGAAIVGGVIGALACGATIICGVAVGAIVGAATYTAQYAGTRSWSWTGLAVSTGWGAVGGFGWGGAAKSIGWRLGAKTSRGLGVRFSSGPTARGTDFTWNGRRQFGIGFHRWGNHRIPVPHYHRRSSGPGGGIGRHRPWQGW